MLTLEPSVNCLARLRGPIDKRVAENRRRANPTPDCRSIGDFRAALHRQAAVPHRRSSHCGPLVTVRYTSAVLISSIAPWDELTPGPHVSDRVGRIGAWETFSADSRWSSIATLPTHPPLAHQSSSHILGAQSGGRASAGQARASFNNTSGASIRRQLHSLAADNNRPTQSTHTHPSHHEATPVVEVPWPEAPRELIAASPASAYSSRPATDSDSLCSASAKHGTSTTCSTSCACGHPSYRRRPSSSRSGWARP